MKALTQWPGSLVLIGAGKMGGAMARGWLAGGLKPSSLTVIDPEPAEEIIAVAASTGMALNPKQPAPPQAIVLAVKPQSLEAVAPSIAPMVREDTLVISIIAGKTIANLKARLPGAGAIVRAMPNTPAAIGRGVSAAFADPATTPAQRVWCESLLGVVGAFHWLDSESAIDAVTAISGSGPAYVFALTEALAAAGERLGLEPELAMNLARGTVEGAAELMRREAGATPAALRRNVTSPGGTTAAALAVLRGENGLDALMARATAAARDRAAEMAG